MSRTVEQRIAQELSTVRAMIGIYCRDQHRTERSLCSECQALWDYAQQRVTHCPFRQDKPTCANCTVHCYKQARREQIRQIMRYAGPKMVWRHPIRALLHLLNGRRKPARNAGR